jgi:signal recognition particle subunit SEC65
MRSRIAEAMRDPNALLRRMPHERRAVLSDNSCRLYHFEMRNYRVGLNIENMRDKAHPPKPQGKMLLLQIQGGTVCIEHQNNLSQIMRIVELKMQLRT